MADSLFYKMRSGKPIKFLCFLKNFASLLVPDVLYRSRLKKKLEKAHHRPDYAYMQQRVDLLYAYHYAVEDGGDR